MIGQTIGNYLVRQRLGEGGMGAVYLAEHPHIGKKVALKILHAEFASNQEVVTRFFNEAKAVNDIGHPNIVDIIDYGVLAAGPQHEAMVYFIMEFLPGLTLTDLMRRESPLSPERSLGIAMQVADALAASHKCNIVHRDLKPDNIILIQRGREKDFVKLLDFGIAKLTGDQPGSRRTRTGIVMGTPAYMSPEQCEGRGNVDHRTDIYALGIVIYEMITGRVPFQGDGYGEILVQHLTQMPAAPSTIRGLIPPHVEAICMKALQKSPDARYPNMEEFMKAIGDPVGYVEANGGIAGFQMARLVPTAGPIPSSSKLTPSPLAPLTPVPGSLTGVGPTPTTLGGAAAEVGGRPGGGKKVGLYVGLAVAATAIGVGVALLASGGKKDSGAAADPGSGSVAMGSGSSAGSGGSAASGGGSAIAGSATTGNGSASAGSATTGSGSAVAGSASAGSGSAVVGSGSAGSAGSATAGSGSATAGSGSAGSGSAGSGSATAGSGSATAGSGSAAAAPEQVTITVDTTPAGASVYFAGEKAARCKSPCSFKVDKKDGNADVMVKLSGFIDEKRSVSLAASPSLDLSLKKTGGATTTAGNTGHTGTGHTGTTTGHTGTTTGHTGTTTGHTGSGHGSGSSSPGDNTINPFDN